jgi:hypothetical protein|tara:strand:- start:3253 stop:3429 length:177 start_codon:yes stop_codon:yes gene_type:complete
MKWFFKRNFPPLMMIVVFIPTILEVSVSNSWYRPIAVAVVITLLFLIIYTEIKHKKTP